MTPEVAILARHRLVMAREALRDADYRIERNADKGAVHRLYYATCHAARALLATRHLDSARHSGVIALFQREFVKPGLIDAEVSRGLPRSFETRLEVDDGDCAEVTSGDTERIRASTVAFLDACEVTGPGPLISGAVGP